MQPLALSEAGKNLELQLEKLPKDKPTQLETIHVADVGGTLYFAYETLRNAAEYSEQHLLLRRAIERFLRRNVNFKQKSPKIARDLITDLTAARYLRNDSVAVATGHKIDQIVADWLAAGKQLGKYESGLKRTEWIFQIASVEIERQLVSPDLTDIFIDFAYGHYLRSIDRSLFDTDDKTFELAAYIAVHKTLIKSDLATVRFYAYQTNASKDFDAPDFQQINQTVDRLHQDPVTNKIGRLINRYGAPMRIVQEIILSTDKPGGVISNRGKMMSRVEAVAAKQYQLTRKRLNEGILRSIVFIFITKVLIGLAIEIPYDLVSTGELSWGPLIINLLFPPLYMATIGWNIPTPGRKNTDVIWRYIDRILYQTDNPVTYTVKRRVSSPTLNAVFNFIYVLAFAVSFSVMVYILRALGYNIVNGTIFFIFFSAVSFFGFRLVQSARELMMIDEKQGIIQTVADFFFTPFIRAGQWLSDNYARVNVVTIILDIMIEMPLKTVLRLMQQWVGFLRDKREEL